MMDLQPGQARPQQREHDEAGEGGQQVGDEVDADGDLARVEVAPCEGRADGRQRGRRADDGDEDEAAVADAGIAEQALEVALRDGGEVAQQQREDRADGQQRDTRSPCRAASPKTPSTMRSRMMSPPAFEPTERNAVIEFGAPS